jgi:hypothetical protein
MPAIPNGATKEELEEGAFIIMHPDGSLNLVGNANGAHAHTNVGAYDEHSFHFVSQAQFTSDEGTAVHSTSILTTGHEFALHHSGEHASYTYDNGLTFQSHYNVNAQGMNMIDIIHVEGTGAQVAHTHIQFEDAFFG